VLFQDNTARTYGGGLSADSTIAVLTNVAFSANQANSWGGGLFSYSGKGLFAWI
jgi:predicted outer membrane repeat protein